MLKFYECCLEIYGPIKLWINFRIKFKNSKLILVASESSVFADIVCRFQCDTRKSFSATTNHSGWKRSSSLTASSSRPQGGDR